MFLPKFGGVIAPLHALFWRPCMKVATRKYGHVRFTLIQHLIVAFCVITIDNRTTHLLNERPKKDSFTYNLCVMCKVSNRTGQGRFRNKGKEVPSLSWDKGTTRQTQNLTTGRDGPGRAGMGRDSLSKSGMGHGTGQSLFFCQNPGRDRDGTIAIFFLWFPVLQHLFLL